MIVKKKLTKVVKEDLPIDNVVSTTEDLTQQLEKDFVTVAQDFQANYEDFHSLIKGKVSANNIVEQLGEIGKDLAIKIKETFPNEEVRKEMVQFTKSTFSFIGDKIVETFPLDEEAVIKSHDQIQNVLKIGIASGILSGFSNDVVFNEK